MKSSPPRKGGGKSVRAIDYEGWSHIHARTHARTHACAHVHATHACTQHAHIHTNQGSPNQHEQNPSELRAEGSTHRTCTGLHQFLCVQIVFSSLLSLWESQMFE